MRLNLETPSTPADGSGTILRRVGVPALNAINFIEGVSETVYCHQAVTGFYSKLLKFRGCALIDFIALFLFA